MKEVAVEELASLPADWLETVQKERLVITQNGKPSAVVFGIKNKDREDWDLQLSPEFWRMIEERRREPTIPWEEAKRQLGLSTPKRRKKKNVKARRKIVHHARTA